MRFGRPMQTVLVVGAALAAASFGTHEVPEPIGANANCDYDDRPSPSFKRQQMLRGTGYAKQRRAAKKRRNRRR